METTGVGEYFSGRIGSPSSRCLPTAAGSLSSSSTMAPCTVSPSMDMMIRAIRGSGSASAGTSRGGPTGWAAPDPGWTDTDPSSWMALAPRDLCPSGRPPDARASTPSLATFVHGSRGGPRRSYVAVISAACDGFKTRQQPHDRLIREDQISHTLRRAMT